MDTTLVATSPGHRKLPTHNKVINISGYMSDDDDDDNNGNEEDDETNEHMINTITTCIQ